ncbi:MAG: hypothetical protein NO482_01750 [Candidatus Methanomethylicia archaeon]|nr:hypothetical protein [Candidatus Methanomethylicia archaeon]
MGLIGPYPRQSQNLPEGYWYPNTAFDSAWFPNNYAIVGSDGKAILRAYSTYNLLRSVMCSPDLWWAILNITPL